MLISFGDFEIDERKFEMRRRGVPVRVAPRVMDTLLYLARNEGRLVTRDELIDGPWAGANVTSSALSQAIKLAREALGESAGRPAHLHTVRGKGFRFTVNPPEHAREGSAPSAAAVSESRGRDARDRSRERSLLSAALKDAHEGFGRVVLITGDSATDKTALLERFVADARAKGTHCFWGRSWPTGGAVRMWPWLEVFKQIIASEFYAPLGAPPDGCLTWSAVAPDLFEFPCPVTDVAGREPSRVVLFDSALRFVLWAASKANLSVVFDDIDAWDEASRELLAYVSARLPGSRLMIVGAVSSEGLRRDDVLQRARCDVLSLA